MISQDDEELYHLDPAVVEDAKRHAEEDAAETFETDGKAGVEHLETTEKA